MAAPKALSRISVNDAALEYIEALERRVARNDLSEATLNAYSADLREFTEMFGADTVLDDIEADHLDTALTRLSKAPDRRFTKGLKIADDGSTPQGRGPHAQARWFAAVRGLFRWSAEKGYVQVDPTISIRPPKTPKRAKGARLGIPIDDARTLRAAPSQRDITPDGKPERKAQRLDYRDEAILRLLTESGPRVSEVCRANRADIRLHEETQRPVLRVLGKGRKERDIPLSDHTVAAIERYQNEQRPAPPQPKNPHDRAETVRIADAQRALFVTVRGWRMSPRDVQRLIERYAKTNLDRRATPHALRHTALTILARSGVDIATVAQIAGHSNISTTSIYMDESMTAATQAIDSSPLGQE